MNVPNKENKNELGHSLYVYRTTTITFLVIIMLLEIDITEGQQKKINKHIHVIKDDNS